MRATIRYNRMRTTHSQGEPVTPLRPPHVTTMLLTNFQEYKKILEFFDFHSDIMQQFILLLVK